MEKQYDEKLLLALGYTDEMILSMKKWDNLIGNYFKDEPDYNDKMYFQIDHRKADIVFRETTPRRIQDELVELFNQVYPNKQKK